MAWTVTADVHRFDDAVAAFRKRVPITDRAFAKLRDKNHARAFTIAGVNDMRTVETVHKEIDRAIKDGLPFDEFKQRIRKKLKDAHGISGSHLETVFRNAVQTSYNTGRWAQLTDPAITNLRPYWVLDVVLDSRTSDVCQPVARTCKPHDDPWWLTNYPPRHHRCRSGVRSVRKREAERIGITRGTPKQTPDDGFGLAPPLRGDDADEPELDDVPPRVRRVYERKKAAGRPTTRAPAKPKTKPAPKKKPAKKAPAKPAKKPARKR